MATPRELAAEILFSFSGPYYVSQTDTQRGKVLDTVEPIVEKRIAEIIKEAQDASI